MTKNNAQSQKWIITSTRVDEKKSAASEGESAQDNHSAMLRVCVAGYELLRFGIMLRKCRQK